MISSKVDYSNKDDYFYNLGEIIHKNDLIIFNNTKVIPARLFGKKLTGGKVEIFFERKISDYDFLALIKKDLISQNLIMKL